MASAKVRGITIELGADTAGVSSALKEVNSSLRSTQSELKDIEKLLKLDPGNVELLAQKHDALQKAVEDSKSKMETLSTAMEELKAQMVDGGTEEQQQQLAALEREYIATEQSCKQYEAQLQETSNAEKNAGDSASEAKDKTKEYGEFAEDAGKKAAIAFAAVAAAIGEALKTTYDIVTETADYGDSIDKMSQKMGVSARTYQEWDFILQHCGSSMETMKTSMKTLATAAETGNESFEALGITQEELATLNQEELFARTIEGLQNVEDTTQRTYLAGKLMGKGATELGALLNLTAEDTEELRNQLYETGGYMEDDQVKASAALKDEMQNLRYSVQGLKNDFAKKLAPTINKQILPAIKNFLAELKKSGAVEKFAEAVSSLADKILPILSEALMYVIENFDKIVSVIGTAVIAYGALNLALGVAGAAQKAFNAVTSANPIGAATVAVVALVAAIAALVSVLNEAKEPTDVMSASQRSFVEDTAAAAKAYQDEKQAAEELAGEQIDNVEYVETVLLPQLQDLVDANGEVKKGEETRAQFIMNELNKALGTEYTQLSDIVDANGRIKQSIFDTIDAKKAQIMLEAYEETYAEAVRNVADAERAQATEALALFDAERNVQLALKDVEDAQASLNYQIETGNVMGQILAQNELAQKQAALAETQRVLSEEQTAYNEASAAVQQYHNDISAYESASIAAMEGKSAETQMYLSRIGQAYKQSAEDSSIYAETEKTAATETLMVAETKLRQMEQDYKTNSAKMTETEKAEAEKRIAAARSEADAAKESFYNVGGNITIGIAEGAEGTSWILDDAMERIINEALDAAKRASDSHSPSRRFRDEIGLMMGLGIAEGIDNSTENIVDSVNKQVGAIMGAYGNPNIVGLNAEVVRSSDGGSGATALPSSTTFIQNNYSPKPLSRLDIYRYGNNLAALQGAL